MEVASQASLNTESDKRNSVEQGNQPAGEVIADLQAVKSHDLQRRLTWLNSLVKHGVTVILLLTLTVFSPIYHIFLLYFAASDQLQDAIEFHRTWFSTIAGIAGTAIGAYYMASKERTS